MMEYAGYMNAAMNYVFFCEEAKCVSVCNGNTKWACHIQMDYIMISRIWNFNFEIVILALKFWIFICDSYIPRLFFPDTYIYEINCERTNKHFYLLQRITLIAFALFIFDIWIKLHLFPYIKYRSSNCQTTCWKRFTDQNVSNMVWS